MWGDGPGNRAEVGCGQPKHRSAHGRRAGMPHHILLALLLEAVLPRLGIPPVACARPELNGRAGHATAYDGRRQQVLLFGGRSDAPGDPYPGSTWAWNGAGWVCLSDDGPPGREDAEMVWDAARERMVLFGGRRRVGQSETILTDTWEWDGQRWSMRDSTGPEPRVHMVMAFDVATRSIVLAGGGSRIANYRDTWQWQGAGWSRQTSVVPEGCIPNTMVSGVTAALLVCAQMDSVAGRIGLFGVRLLELRNRQWTPASDPGPRFSPRAATAASREQILLFDGWPPPQAPAVTQVFERGAWSVAEGPGPEKRRSPSLAYDAGRRRIVLYGGSDDSGIRNDTWEWDGAKWTRASRLP